MEPLSNARAASDTRHRIAAANSQPRRIKLVGLGSGGTRIVRGIDTLSLNDVQILIPDSSAAAMAASTLPGLVDAEMIFLVAVSGDDLALAPFIKQIARASNVMITGILVQSGVTQGTAQAELLVLRAASDILIVATDASYVSDMLVHLGA